MQTAEEKISAARQIIGNAINEISNRTIVTTTEMTDLLLDAFQKMAVLSGEEDARQ